MLEYWSGPKREYQFPDNVKWTYKTDTDLYEFVKVRKFFIFHFARFICYFSNCQSAE